MKTKYLNHDAAQYWWLMFCSGVLFIALGIWMLAAPVSSYLSLGLLFAFGMIFAGIFETTFAISNHKRLRGWGWTLSGGLIDIFLGGYLLNFPLLTMVVMPIIIGLWMLFRGFMAISSSIELRAYGVLDWAWLLLTGILIVILSVLIIGDPFFGDINIVVWTAFAFLLSGIFRIFLSLQLRGLVRNI
ncbi:HdeD family acid-resistance protein [Pedobacter steynii]